MSKTQSEVVKKISMMLIDGPVIDQRLEIDQEEIVELAESIKEVGLQQPVLITPRGKRFEIVWGHRRYLAHKYLGKVEILAKIQTLTQNQIVILRGTENLFRKDITPIEEAYIYHGLVKEGKLTIEQIATKMRKSAGIIRRRLDLLRMPEVLQKAIQKRKIGYAVAEDLWSLGDVAAIEYYLQFAVEHGATSAVVRQWVRDEKDQIRRKASGAVGGRDTIALNQEKPVYVACDVCQKPMEIGDETVLRCCKKCGKTIVEAMKKDE